MKSRRLGPVLLFLAFGLVALMEHAAAALRVDVTQGTPQPLPIAIPDFVGSAPAPGANIASVVRAVLDRSGLFKPLDTKSFLDQSKDINVPPNFANWRVINARALVTAQQTTQAEGRVLAAFRLWDVYGQQQIGEGLSVCAQQTSWRRIAHKISDSIYERITGEKGYFDTRIVFISESGPALTRKNRLAGMEQGRDKPVLLTRRH